MSLKLGAIPEEKPVRMAITLPAAVARDLELYATVWSRETGRVLSAQALVPHILAAFMRGDRGFAQARRSQGQERDPEGATVDGGADDCVDRA